MINRQMINIYHALSQTEYRTANELAVQLGVSTKTVRNQLKNLSELLRDHGACVETKHAVGCRLVVNDADKLKSLEKTMQNQELQQSSIPNSSAERVRYLLEYLLNSDRYVKLDDLSDQLYISKRTLSGNLKAVERVLEEYDLHLQRKPSYGIRVEGAEFSRRLCMAEYTTSKIWVNEKPERALEVSDEMQWIYRCVQECFLQNDFAMSGVALLNLLFHIQIAIMRMQRGHFVPGFEDEIEQMRHKKAYQIAEKILSRVCMEFHVSYRDSEVAYIAVHLQGKEMGSSTLGGKTLGGNFVITQQISDLADDMLALVHRAFGFDFRHDLEFILMLRQHLVPLMTRLQYKMRLYNPLMQDIKEQYLLAYCLAATASQVLRQKYQTPIKEDEIGYLALLFELALEHDTAEITRKNILLVCAGGKSSAHLRRHSYQKAFGAYIDQVHVCDVNHLREYDLTDIDYIFTTVPIPFKVAVPIQEVRAFLTGSDVRAVRQVLQGSGTPVADLCPPALFLPHCRYATRRQALQALCDYVQAQGLVPPDFAEAVAAREELTKTCYANLVAMPGPLTAAAGKPFLCAAVLEEPIPWTEEQQDPVQVIFLASVANHEGVDVQRFYAVMAKLMNNSAAIQELIQAPSHTALQALLAQTERLLDNE